MFSSDQLKLNLENLKSVETDVLLSSPKGIRG